MDLDEIRALVAVADHGSVKAASRALGIDRSTLRRRVDALEARVGTELLLRDHRGAELTHSGRAIVERGRGLVREADHLLALGRGDVEPSGDLTFLATTGMPPRAYGFLQQTLASMMPRVRLAFVESEDPLGRGNDHADFIVHWGPDSPGDAWRTHEMTQGPIRALASPAWLDANGRPESLRQLLTEHRILEWRQPGVEPPRWRDADGRLIEYTPAVTASSPIYLFFMAAASGGVALVPEGGFDIAGLDEGALVRVLEDEIRALVPLCVSYRAILRADPRVSQLIAMIDQFVAIRTPSVGHDEVFTGREEPGASDAAELDEGAD